MHISNAPNHYFLALCTILMICLTSTETIGAAVRGVAPEPIFLGADLTSNRFDGMPSETLQIVTAYDSSGTDATLFIEVTEPTLGLTTFIESTDTASFTTRIDTFEYDLNGYQPTGLVRVEGVVPNGVIDGLAFGLYWKDASGTYHMMRSNLPGEAAAHFFGAWPLGMDDGSFQSSTPQITDNIARQHARATIYGAALMPNGTYACALDTGGECASLFMDGFESGDTSRWD